MEEAPVRKSDIPFFWRGKVMLIIMIGASASILYGVLTDPADRAARPGIVDGIVGAALSVLLIRVLTPWLASGWERWVIDKRRTKLWLLNGPFHPASPVAFFGSVLVSVAAGYFLRAVLGLRWPWCGLPPAVLPGFIGFSIAISYAFLRWYASLPE